MENHEYDLVVIGSGPAGQKGAICAAKLRKKVAIIDRKRTIGGVCVHTGTIPSKTLREAVLYLSGFRQRTFYGRGYVLKDRISMADLIFRAQAVMAREIEVIKAQLRRNYVTTFEGDARFTDPNTIEVQGEDGSHVIHGSHVLVACGTRPAHSQDIPIDGHRIFDSDQLHSLEEVPRELIIVGAGIIGLEYASMFATLGVKVTLLDQRPVLVDFADREIIESLCFQLRQLGTVFRLGEKVVSVGFDEERDRVFAKLESGKNIHGQGLLYTIGRQANSDQLNIESAGLSPDARGKLAVNDHFQTAVSHIYAAGDVIGFPALASTSMEQGRLASCHMFGKPGTMPANLIPYGIYTIPEISMVGLTEEQLTKEKIPYEVGLARYAELAKAQMLGDEEGLLKLLFDPDSLKLLGVHIIGDRAAEIIHIGQVVLTMGGTIQYFRDAVFNYPTLAEAYKVAALDGLNKL
ncbi:MAG: Si-specific NAD(P)(+) transhydrogenase [Acidobacteria bacterium]|jgi:NAD(P) transhydrogenase|nr:MAG: Si-specific NAD(P)(+) transhydrogenase [Acidobacteriota bacterium]